MKDWLKDLGLSLLGIAQIITILVAVFAATPLLLNTFLGLENNFVRSGSMAPTFHTGDIVVTKQPLGGSLQVGNIVGIDYEGTRYTHRVMEVLEDGTAITQGDANNTPDLFKPAEADIWGEVVVVIDQPLAGLLTLFTLNKDWPPQVIAAANGEVSWLSVLATAPWGVLGLIIAIFLFWWVFPDIAASREAKQAKEAEATDEGVTPPENGVIEEAVTPAPTPVAVAARKAIDAKRSTSDDFGALPALPPVGVVNPFETRPRARHQA